MQEIKLRRSVWQERRLHSAEALMKKLENGNITMHMDDYADFEKVSDLGFRLPTNDRRYTTKPGDITAVLSADRGSR